MIKNIILGGTFGFVIFVIVEAILWMCCEVSGRCKDGEEE